MVRLAQIMTADVFTVAPDSPVAEAAAAMVKRRFGSAVVMQGQILVGIFSERDVLRAAASGGDLARSPASRWMTHDPETVAPDTDSERAAEIMLSHGFRHLPIVEGTRLVGNRQLARPPQCSRSPAPVIAATEVLLAIVGGRTLTPRALGQVPLDGWPNRLGIRSRAWGFT
jgi:predicted transcriptional regulator